MPSRTLALSHDLIARAHPEAVADEPDAQVFLTDTELAPGLTAALADRGETREGLWVFGYGSLMWQPEFAIAEQRVGTVQGWQRRFCLLQRRFRGSTARPGLVLALEAGGFCTGLVFRLDGHDPHALLMPVWRREMKGQGYEPRWVIVETDAGPVTALTFVVNRASDRHVDRDEPALADLIATGCGHLGPSATYLLRTVEACETLGIDDPHLWSLQALVAERMIAACAGSLTP